MLATKGFTNNHESRVLTCCAGCRLQRASIKARKNSVAKPAAEKRKKTDKQKKSAVARNKKSAKKIRRTSLLKESAADIPADEEKISGAAEDEQKNELNENTAAGKTPTLDFPRPQYPFGHGGR